MISWFKYSNSISGRHILRGEIMLAGAQIPQGFIFRGQHPPGEYSGPADQGAYNPFLECFKAPALIAHRLRSDYGQPSTSVVGYQVATAPHKPQPVLGRPTKHTPPYPLNRRTLQASTQTGQANQPSSPWIHHPCQKLLLVLRTKWTTSRRLASAAWVAHCYQQARTW